MLPCVWFSNGSQKTSKCGKNISDTLGYASCATYLFLPHFDVICDLLLNRRTATWNLFVNYIITQVILAFWLVLAYDLLEDRCTIDVIITEQNVFVPYLLPSHVCDCTFVTFSTADWGCYKVISVSFSKRNGFIFRFLASRTSSMPRQNFFVPYLLPSHVKYYPYSQNFPPF